MIFQRYITYKMFYSLLIFLLLFSSIQTVFPESADATNISQWCFDGENIRLLFREDDLFGNGSWNIWAVGDNGRIAKFNGVLWEPIEKTTYAFYSFTLDKKNKCIWALSGTSVRYWNRETGWVYAGDVGGRYTNRPVNVTVNNSSGEVWVGTDMGCIYKWNGSTGWTKIFQMNDSLFEYWDSGRCRNFFFDDQRNCIWFSWNDDGSDPKYYVSYYALDSKSYKRVELIGYSVSTMGINDFKLLGSTLYAMEIRSYYANGVLLKYNGSSFISLGNTYLERPKIFISNGNIYFCGRSNKFNRYPFSLSSSWPFTEYIFSVCEGKYGEIYAAGQGGKFAIYMNDTWYTDSNVFSDIYIGEAKDYSLAAKIAAENAQASAEIAAANTWDSAEGKSAATLSKEARDKANTAANNTAYIRNTQLPGIENKIDNLQTVVNNINNYIGADTTAPSLDWATVSGAYSTSGSSIDIIITASDNVSSNLEYSINGSAYSALPSDGIVSAPVTNSGPNAIVVRVRDEAGNVASKVRTVWKL